MKTKNIILSFMMCMGLIFSGCTDSFDNLNDDPNRVNEGDYDFSVVDLGTALKYGGNLNYVGDDGGLAGGGHLFERIKYLSLEAFTQYHANAGVPQNGWVEDYWKAEYSTWLSLLNGVIRDAAIYEDRENTAAVARIWRVYLHANAVDFFGPTPFSFDPLELDPPYVPLNEIHEGFFKELDEAVKQFDTEKNVVEKEDFIYNGDVLKWKKLANTLRLRLAMKISEIDPVLAKTQILAALKSEGGVMGSENDDALAYYYSGWAEGPAYGDLSWNTYNMTTTMEKMISGIGGVAYDGPATGIKPTNVDPRGKKMWDPSTTGSNFKGMNVSPLASGQRAVTAVMNNEFKSKTTRRMQLVTYTETCFLLAEAVERGFVSSGDAGGTAKAWYEKGIESSFKWWDVADKASVYIASSAKNGWGTSARYDDIGGTGNTKIEKIVTQRYIAFYPDLSGQIWNDKRRLNLPAMDIPESRDSGAGSWPNDNDIKNPANFVQRSFYPQSENLLNKEKYQAGVAQIGGVDKLTSRLWWASKGANYCTSN